MDAGEPIFTECFRFSTPFGKLGRSVRTPFSMNVLRFRHFYKLSSIRQVGENLKQSLKMNQKPRSKPSVRLKLGWSLGGDRGESSRADFSTNVSGFQLLLGT